MSDGFRLVGASVSVAGRTLLEPVDLHLRPGRIYGVIGRNGAGKSTLLRLIARQIFPSSGHVTLDGQDLAALADRTFARRVAHMAQATPPLDMMVVRELVALGRYPWHGAFGRMQPGDSAAVAEALHRTGLEALANRPLASLSGGELQRARLAMMLAQGADWLILDEPSAALDLAWALELLRHLRALADAGRSIVIALHDVNLAARFCDDLLGLKSGRIIAGGPVTGMFRPDLLSTIFDTEITVARLPDHPVAVPLG